MLNLIRNKVHTTCTEYNSTKHLVQKLFLSILIWEEEYLAKTWVMYKKINKGKKSIEIHLHRAKLTHQLPVNT